MKESLDDLSRKGLVDYRMERALETLSEADLMATNAHYNAAVNRLYYACFYAAQALLIANSMDASTHKGVNLLLGLHFVRTHNSMPTLAQCTASYLMPVRLEIMVILSILTTTHIYVTDIR